MNKISYRRHRFPAEIIQRAVWLCFRFPLSYRDVEDLLAERGVDVSYETIRRWALKFQFGKLRQFRRHLDEVFSSINGKRITGGQRGLMLRSGARRSRCCRAGGDIEGRDRAARAKGRSLNVVAKGETMADALQ